MSRLDVRTAPSTVRHRVLMALICWVSTWVGSGQAPPPTASPETFAETWLDGKVGTAEVKVFLDKASYPREGLEGMYFRTTDWAPLPLEGDWSSPQRIRLREGTPGNPPEATFDLDLSQSQVVGTRTSWDGSQVLPVRLQRVPQPPPFEVAIRRARRFQNASWPITLSYPAGWRLVVSETHLALRSPDPRDLLFDNELACVRGVGLPAPPASNEDPVELEWPFFRGPSGWLAAGRDGCEVDTCQPPEIRNESAGMFMNTAYSYQASGPWGYAGIGAGRAYLIVVGDEWVHCRDRLLDRDSRISIVDSRRR